MKMKSRTKKTIRRLFSMLAVLTILCQLPAGAATLTENAQISTENMLAVLDNYPEDTSLRTEIEKHFRYGENGYIASVYTDPVHYLDSNNEWKDIDNTLKLVAPTGDAVAALSSTGSYYENTAYQTVNRMYVGSNASSGTAYESRIYIRFPWVSAIDEDAYIGSAAMRLDHYPVSSWQTADQNILDVYEVPSGCNWKTDEINWNNQASYQFTNRVTSYVSDADGSFGYADITSLVRKWYYNSKSNNNGLVIKPHEIDTVKTNRTCYYSSDCDAAYAGKRPRILIYYYPDSCELYVSLHAQEKENWCWAACAQMVAERYGYQKSQSSIVTAVKGSAIDEGADGAPEIIAALEYATTVTTNNVTTHLDFTSSTTVSKEILYETLRNGDPIIVAADNHVVVVYGYTDWGGDDLFLVHDPWPVNAGESDEMNFANLTAGFEYIVILE